MNKQAYFKMMGLDKQAGVGSFISSLIKGTAKALSGKTGKALSTSTGGLAKQMLQTGSLKGSPAALKAFSNVANIPQNSAIKGLTEQERKELPAIWKAIQDARNSTGSTRYPAGGREFYKGPMGNVLQGTKPKPPIKKL